MGHVSEKFMAKEESTAFPALRKSQTCTTAPPKSPPRLRCFRGRALSGAILLPTQSLHTASRGEAEPPPRSRRITQRGSSQPVLPPTPPPRTRTPVTVRHSHLITLTRLLMPAALERSRLPHVSHQPHCYAHAPCPLATAPPLHRRSLGDSFPLNDAEAILGDFEYQGASQPQIRVLQDPCQPNVSCLTLSYDFTIFKLQIAVWSYPPFWYLRDREPQSGWLHVVQAAEYREQLQLNIRPREQTA